MKPNLEKVRHAFFEAMKVGWAPLDVAISEIPIPLLPGVKMIPFVIGDFRVVDAYLTTACSEMSSGTTTIWRHDEPIWVMHYGGWYAKEVIPFLKTCLRQAYDERHFYGGRGRPSVKIDDYIYENFLERNDFNDFMGQERIIDVFGKQYGHHWYRGMSPIDNSSLLSLGATPTPQPFGKDNPFHGEES